MKLDTFFDAYTPALLRSERPGASVDAVLSAVFFLVLTGALVSVLLLPNQAVVATEEKMAALYAFALYAWKPTLLFWTAFAFLGGLFHPSGRFFPWSGRLGGFMMAAASLYSWVYLQAWVLGTIFSVLAATAFSLSVLCVPMRRGFPLPDPLTRLLYRLPPARRRWARGLVPGHVLPDDPVMVLLQEGDGEGAALDVVVDREALLREWLLDDEGRYDWGQYVAARVHEALPLRVARTVPQVLEAGGEEVRLSDLAPGGTRLVLEVVH